MAAKWTDLVPIATQPFWGWPFAFIPAGVSATNKKFAADLGTLNTTDSRGNLDPNWAIPQNLMSPWDTALIMQTPVPGKVKLDCKKAQRIDKRHSPGYSGANATMLGFDTAEVDMEISIWTEDQFFQLQSMFLYLTQLIAIAQTATRGQVLGAIEVEHPKLSMLNIQRLYVRQLMPPDESETPGVMKARIRFDEFAPATKGSSQTISGAPKPASIPNAFSTSDTKSTPPSQGPGSQP